MQGYNLEKTKQDQLFVKQNDRKALKENGLRNLVPLLEGCEIVEYPCDQSTLTQRYFDRTIAFIKQSKDNPFFIYSSFPHLPPTDN